jgi:hypothetical protein
MTKYSSFSPVEIGVTGRYNIHKIKKEVSLHYKGPMNGFHFGTVRLILKS